MARLTTALCLLLVALAGCDTQPPGTDCPDAPGCPDPNTPDIVAGVDLNALFAAPTQAERDSVAARLARTGGTSAARITAATATQLATDPDGTRYTLLTLRDSLGRTVTSAVARTPFAVTDPLPALLILPDGEGNASEADFLTGATAAQLDRRTVQVVVAARGATLTTRGVSVVDSVPIARHSEVNADPYRADVLDVLALIEYLGLVPRVEPSPRVAATGIGRGGAMALLAAERAPGRFRAIVPMSAPTSLFDGTFRVDVRSVLTGGSAGRLPAAEALVAPARAVSRGEISLEEARLRMLEVSAVAGADRLPATHAYHASDDDVVPLAHLMRLRERGDGTTRQPHLFDAVPEVTHAEMLRDATLRGLLSDFLDRYLLDLVPM